MFYLIIQTLPAFFSHMISSMFSFVNIMGTERLYLHA